MMRFCKWIVFYTFFTIFIIKNCASSINNTLSNNVLPTTDDLQINVTSAPTHSINTTTTTPFENVTNSSNGYSILNITTTRNISNTTTAAPITETITTPYVLVKCPKLLPFNNGVRKLSDNHRDYAAGTVVSFLCDKYFVLRGSNAIKCLKTGIWNGTQPYCYEQTPSCKFSHLGTEYRGRLSITKTNQPCLKWESLRNANSQIVNTRFPDRDIFYASNFCRNPEMKPGGPYCYYKGNATVEWEYCNIQYCPGHPEECKKTILGKDYRGVRRTTLGGIACQRWDKQEPHAHTNFDSTNFPDTSVSAAENFCRNPDGEPEGPWCFTMEKTVVWRYCFVPYCPVISCRKTVSGHDYQGTQSYTKSHKICQRWDKSTPQYHNFRDPSAFPDATIYEASNYCRNPDNKHGGPWCYTIDKTKPWEYCDVPMCSHNVPSNWVSIFGQNLLWKGEYMYKSEKRKFKLKVLSAGARKVITLFEDDKNSFHMQGYYRSDDRIVFEMKGIKTHVENEFQPEPFLVAGQLVPKGSHWNYQGIIDAATKGFTSFYMTNYDGSEKSPSKTARASGMVLAVQIIIGLVVVIVLIAGLAGLMYYLKKRRLIPFQRNYMAYANFQNPLYDS